MPDEKKASEFTNGIILADGGAGAFSGVGDPSFSAPIGSIYLDTANTRMWHRHSGHWHLFHDGDATQRNSVLIFSSDVNGENVNTGSFQAYFFKPVAGPDQYINPTFNWGVVGESSSGGTMTVRIVKKSDATLVGTLTWDNETTPTFKTIDITANVPNGTEILQIEAKRTSGAGKLYSSGIEVIYG